MFNNLSENITNVFKSLNAKKITSSDVENAMSSIRIALLEADVSLNVVKDFIERTKQKALGVEVIKSVAPADQIVKIVQDELCEFLGGQNQGLNLKTKPPAVVMMVGLQGSGKTTSTGKIANLLAKKQGKKCLLASLDVYRPAAQEQLEILGQSIAVDTLPIISGEKPEKIAKRALKQAKKGFYDVLFIDTAGRLQIDESLMAELKKINKITAPSETLLVADSLTGQEAVNVATRFNEEIGISGIMLTRIDGDGRGGAALSMKQATGCDIKFIGTGEKIEAIEAFHPERIASRILDMGDVVTLVEKAQEVVKKDEIKKIAKKLKKGKYDLNDLLDHINKISKMGGISSILKMLPGAAGLEMQLKQAGFDEETIKKQKAIIYSMTKRERSFPKLIENSGSRKKRIARGSGSNIPDINKLLKQFRKMQNMFSKMGKNNMFDQMGLDMENLDLDAMEKGDLSLLDAGASAAFNPASGRATGGMLGGLAGGAGGLAGLQNMLGGGSSSGGAGGAGGLGGLGGTEGGMGAGMGGIDIASMAKMLKGGGGGMPDISSLLGGAGSSLGAEQSEVGGKNVARAKSKKVKRKKTGKK